MLFEFFKLVPEFNLKFRKSGNLALSQSQKHIQIAPVLYELFPFVYKANLSPFPSEFFIFVKKVGIQISKKTFFKITKKKHFV